MTVDEARETLERHGHVRGASKTGPLAQRAARVGTRSEQPGDREAAAARLEIKAACRVLHLAELRELQAANRRALRHPEE